MKLSTNFTLEEMTRTEQRDMLQKNIDIATDDAKIKANLIRVATELLEPIRGLFKKPVIVNSGFRYPELNEKIGGSKTSQHCRGEAADIVVRGYETPEKQIEMIKKIMKELPDLKFGQMLQEHGCVHVSLGTKKEIAYYSVKDKKKIPINLGE